MASFILGEVQFMPSVNRLKNGNIQVSDLFISATPFPHALRQILGILFSTTFSGEKVSQKFVIDQIKNAESMIISKNLDFYLALMKTLNDNESAPNVLLSDIKDIAKHQPDKLNKYSFDDTFYTRAENLFA